jgi:hypothetical protein
VVMKEYSYTSTPPMGRTACTEPQCLYKGALYLTYLLNHPNSGVHLLVDVLVTVTVRVTVFVSTSVCKFSPFFKRKSFRFKFLLFLRPQNYTLTVVVSAKIQTWLRGFQLKFSRPLL